MLFLEKIDKASLARLHAVFRPVMLLSHTHTFFEKNRTVFFFLILEVTVQVAFKHQNLLTSDWKFVGFGALLRSP